MYYLFLISFSVLFNIALFLFIYIQPNVPFNRYTYGSSIFKIYFSSLFLTFSRNIRASNISKLYLRSWEYQIHKITELLIYVFCIWVQATNKDLNFCFVSFVIMFNSIFLEEDWNPRRPVPTWRIGEDLTSIKGKREIKYTSQTNKRCSIWLRLSCCRVWSHVTNNSVWLKAAKTTENLSLVSCYDVITSHLLLLLLYEGLGELPVPVTKEYTHFTNVS